MGHRIAVMSEGVHPAGGQPADLYEQPTNAYVASFIGSPPMNFLDGRVDRWRHRPQRCADDPVGRRRRPCRNHPRRRRRDHRRRPPGAYRLFRQARRRRSAEHRRRGRYGRAARPHHAGAGEAGVRQTAERAGRRQGPPAGGRGRPRHLPAGPGLSVRPQERTGPARHRRKAGRSAHRRCVTLGAGLPGFTRSQLPAQPPTVTHAPLRADSSIAATIIWLARPKAKSGKQSSLPVDAGHQVVRLDHLDVEVAQSPRRYSRRAGRRGTAAPANRPAAS